MAFFAVGDLMWPPSGENLKKTDPGFEIQTPKTPLNSLNLIKMSIFTKKILDQMIGFCSYHLVQIFEN